MRYTQNIFLEHKTNTVTLLRTKREGKIAFFKHRHLARNYLRSNGNPTKNIFRFRNTLIQMEQYEQKNQVLASIRSDRSLHSTKKSQKT